MILNHERVVVLLMELLSEHGIETTAGCGAKYLKSFCFGSEYFDSIGRLSLAGTRCMRKSKKKFRKLENTGARISSSGNCIAFISLIYHRAR